MPRITVTISDELDEYLEEKSGEGKEFNSKSEVMRNLAQRGQEADDLEIELDIKQNRIEDLERQMGARDQVEEKVDLLANRIEEEQSSPDPPFFVEWVQWFRSRGGDSDQEKSNSDES
jgi:Arc/MetJ-type ribon-helix-helix transcriptional regulator